jgi:hypothetical protein
MALDTGGGEEGRKGIMLELRTVAPLTIDTRLIAASNKQ